MEEVSVICGSALESTAMAHNGVGEQLAKDEEEISANDILWSVVQIGSVYFMAILMRRPSFFIFEIKLLVVLSEEAITTS